MKWISVKDRLPEDDQDVWYYVDTVGVHKGKYVGGFYFMAEFKKTHFLNVFRDKDGILTNNVTHWIPYKNRHY